MQDMSVVTTEPASSPPRILSTDVTSVERAVTHTKDNTKTTPKNKKKESSLENAVINLTNRSVNSPGSTKENLDLQENHRQRVCKVSNSKFTTVANLEKHTATHSADRIHKCKMCDLTFNSNASMGRHMRTHKQLPNQDTDSDDSGTSGQITPSGSPLRNHLSRKRRLEHNNNDKATNGNGSTSADDSVPGEKKKPKFINNNEVSPLHRYMSHHNDRKDASNKKALINSVSGFKDCAIIDFSSQKFPLIAKEVCEKNIHKSITEQKFRCDRCGRDFPCESAADIHKRACFQLDSKVSKTRRESSSTDEDARRDDFFAKLDLKNRSPNYAAALRPLADIRKPNVTGDFYPTKEIILPQMDTSKDLADIQSILSVASTGGLLEQLTHKSQDMPSRIPEQSNSSRNTEEHEEVQDMFAAEFRKMKLRGEFPCRLCTAVFPNLRALKGHNRVHLSTNATGPYRCNMCPNTSLDKAALVRHMRTHNGDRPYECAVCNYAFTTKANCERHLRNRHSKVSREEVKRSIIYHPSEDPNNDEVNSKLNISREEIKRPFVCPTFEVEYHEEPDMLPKDRTPPIVQPLAREPPPPPTYKDLPITLPRDLSIVIPQPRDIRAHCSMEALRHPIPPIPEELLKVRIHAKGFAQLTQIPEFTPESDGDKEPDSDEEIEPVTKGYSENHINYLSETPMDLSTSDCQEDVLDLSKKRVDKVDEPQTPEPVDTYIPKTIEFNNNHSSNAEYNAFVEKAQHMAILHKAQQLHIYNDVNLPKLDQTSSFLANQLANQISRCGLAFGGLGMSAGYPVWPAGFFLSPHCNSEIKELFNAKFGKSLQLSGGGLVDHNLINSMALTEQLQALHHQTLNNMASPDLKPHTPGPIKTEDDIKPPLHINTDTPTTVFSPNPILASPKLPKKETLTNHSPNSVKMVIKNGVLMPKQKQRRYRTERPFSCEHCSARFTLRSNMERHIKQQHPQYWSQRQRSSIGLTRKSPISLIPPNITVPSLNYDSRINLIKSLPPTNDISVSSSLILEDKDSNQPTGISVNKSFSLMPEQYAMLHKQSIYFAQKPISSKPVISQTVDNEEEDDDALIIDEEESNDSKSHQTKEVDMKNDGNPQVDTSASNFLSAKKVAHEILIDVSSKNQHPDIAKDFDWKIAGNLIAKNAPIKSVVSTFTSQVTDASNKEALNAANAVKENKQEEGDLVPVSRLLDNAVTQIKFFKNEFNTSGEISQHVMESSMAQQGDGYEDEEEDGLVASSGSTSEGNNSGSDENRSESETTTQVPQKKKSAYSLAPNRVCCPYCHRKFPWSSSLRRHVLTHTGQKPYKCPHCPLLFTTKSNCDRHLLRKHGSHSLPTQQNTTPIASTPDLPPNSVSIPGLGNQGFMMRNVPERPFKCAGCPSSTFATLSNLKKHMSSKHGVLIPDSRPGSPKTEEGHQSGSEHRDNDSHFTSDDEKLVSRPNFTAKTSDSSENKSDWDSQISSKYSPNYAQDAPSNMQNSDLPFKCHLCDSSFGERQDCLDHIRDTHSAEFELLMAKGALEASASFSEELGSGHKSEGGEEHPSDDLQPEEDKQSGEDKPASEEKHLGEENGEQQRGKFPDYANRKVVCAFCLRRFWSAEDLRRHMRTHTGERPFSCDVCRRRFTLKHSMLRHRKKHTSTSASCEDLSTASGDDESVSPSSSTQNYTKSSSSTLSPLSSSYSSLGNTSTPISSKNAHLTLNGYQMAIHKNLSPDVPSNVNNNNSPPAHNSYKGKVKVINPDTLKRVRYSTDDNDGQESEMESGNDLIGNLLGISDRGMINKLLSSADEAAKLLGVNK